MRYADARGITVIPEINMPGHSRAAVMSMESRYHRLLAEGSSEADAAAFRLVDPDDTTSLLTVQYYHRHSTINPAVARCPCASSSTS